MKRVEVGLVSSSVAHRRMPALFMQWRERMPMMIRRTICLTAVVFGLRFPGEASPVRLGGALGARFDLTVTNNYLKLDLGNDFFKPFRERTSKEGFVGLGMLCDAAVRLAKYSGDPEVIARKDAIVGFLIGNQLADGYTGCFAEKARLSKLWDIHVGVKVPGTPSKTRLD